MYSRFAVALLAAVTLAAAACGGVTDPSKNKTETFTGTLTIGGSNVHLFSASNSGEYSVTVKSLTPSANVFLYTAFGQVLSGNCSIVQQNIASTVGFESLNGAIVPGSYCVQIADQGGLTQTETYVLEVSHP